MKTVKNIGWAFMLWVSFITTAILLGSCSTPAHYISHEHKKSVNRARRALDKKIYTSQVQYVIVNNQIIMFENIN